MLPFHVSCVRLVRSTLVALWTPPTFWSPRILRIKIPPWLQVLIQLELRQKKLQDFVSKNNQDFAKKLKDEQEKAKASQ